MKRTGIVTLWCFVLTLTLQLKAGLGFQTVTHRRINRSAAQGLLVPFFDQLTSFDDFLRLRLGLSDGLNTFVNGKSILEWIDEGGAAEDQFFGSETFGGLTRSPRHFHTPLRSWDQSGLNLPGVQFESSVRWAQLPDQGFAGRAAWRDARETYFQALTATSFSERQRLFGETFMILGQLMHLVGDLASPAHTRNDSHLPGNSDDFEGYMEDHPEQVAGFEGIDPSLLQQTTGDLVAEVPVARIWDTDSYNGSNPGVTTGSTPEGATIGLAEFTSANFFSDDTITPEAFADPDLPFPAIDRLSPGPIDVYPVTGSNRQYLSKLGDGVSPINHMVAEGVFVRFTPPFFQRYVLDDLVFQDYAAKLLPRAIGYSAGLIEYFFRAVTDFFPFSEACQYNLTNDTLGEMFVGVIPIPYTSSEHAGEGQLIAVIEFPLPNPTSIIVSEPKQVDLSSNDLNDLTFIFPQGSFPENVSGRTYVVYKGPFGQEPEAVIGGPAIEEINGCFR